MSRHAPLMNAQAQSFETATTTSNSLRASLLESYRLQSPPSDEMWCSEPFYHAPREHWRHCIEQMEFFGADELLHRQQALVRLLRDNGVTYSIYNDPQGLHRTWQLDMVPFIIGQHDWQHIEAGLQQRAELLNMIYADIYGAQRLIKEGFLPLELVYAHDGFLRPCHNTRFSSASATQRPLRLYAADVARGPDGRFWVLSDRTQAPSGAGYALENRVVMARILPELFKTTTANVGAVRNLTSFFEAFHENLVELAPIAASEAASRRAYSRLPRIVILTPGPRNEAHFEHAFLASSLGYTLVQGEDLMMREGAVWLKSLHGLQRVDVILRRMDDVFCDPLQLRSDSQLGVAGLVQAVRRGNVAVANPLGSGVLENPALLPFLPSLARHLLGEDLLLPSAATWWCGQPLERQFVLDNLSSLIIKPIHRQAGTTALFGRELSSEQLSTLRSAIEQQPHLYVGQEYVSFSTLPSFIQGRFEPRYAVLRAFLTASRDGYCVMPGGLTRAASDKNTFLVSNQSGGVSKDTWVLASEPMPEQTASSIPIITPPVLHTLSAEASSELAVPTLLASSSVVSSRTAENLFWVGRYAERAQSTARLLRLIVQQFAELSLAAHHSSQKVSQTEVHHIQQRRYDSARRTNETLTILLCTLTQMTMTYPGFVGDGCAQRLAHPEPEMLSVIFDTTRTGSLAFTLQAMIRAVYAVRDRWSSDTWRVLGDIEDEWNSQHGATLEAGTTLFHVHHALDRVVSTLAAFWGLNMESMSYDEGWFILDAGRRLERGLLLSSMVRSMLVFRTEPLVEQVLMEYALDVNESLTMYRSRYRSYMHLPTVLDMLLLDKENPRSLVYQLERLQRRIGDFPRMREAGVTRLSEEERFMLEALTLVRVTDAAALSTVSATETALRTALEQVLAQVSQRLAAVSVCVSQAFFSHAQLQRTL